MNKVITQIDSRGVAQVTLNNPDKHNAFDDQMIIELTNAFNALAANANVRIMPVSYTHLTLPTIYSV